MIIKKKDSTLETFASGKIFDYPMPDEKTGISSQEHHGRVPETGWGVNTVCHEIYYVISGSAEVFIDDEQTIIEEGDIVILEPGKKSYLIADNLKLLTITEPNWYPEQYQEIHN